MTPRTAAIPAALTLTAALAFLPTTAATAVGGSSGSDSSVGGSALTSGAAADGPSLSYVVNTRPG
ncbi:peptidase S8, partial [Streptomyces sp. MCAF7]